MTPRTEQQEPVVGAPPSTSMEQPSAQASDRRGPLLLVSVASIVAVLVLWWVLTTGLNVLKPLTFPSPEEVWQAAKDLRGQLLSDALATLLRVVVAAARPLPAAA
jgi:ABC-type nitrate/sulfonate/bicarbonate transport system permease component